MRTALARGEKRVIGFSPDRGQAQVSTWWGMGIVTAVLGLLFVVSWVILLLPPGMGEQPFWGALFLMALAGLGGWYTFGMARDEYRVTRLRKERRAPKPGGGYVS